MTVGKTYTPDIYVEFAFGYGALADTTEGSWTNVTTAFPNDLIVDDIDIQRGRENELDLFSAGTAMVTFKDRLRKLDPSNASGPYYGNLKPRTPMRIRAVFSATSYVRFSGYVDGWPVQGGRGQSVVSVTATDAFKLFAGITLPNIYDYEVLSDSPNAYWRLGETTGQRAVDSSTTRADGEYLVFSRQHQGQPKVVPYGGDGSLDTTGRTKATAVQDSYVGMVIVDEGAKVGVNTTGSMTVECWIAAGDDAAAYHQRQDIVGQGAGGTWGFGWQVVLFPASYNLLLPPGSALYGDDDKLIFANSNFDVYWAWNVPTLFDGDPHHIVVRLDVVGGAITGPTAIEGGQGGATLHVDGAFVEPVVNYESSAVVRMDSPIFVGTGAYLLENVAFRGRVDSVALYRSTLSTTRIAEHYEAGTAPWDAETTGVRIGRVLDLIGWPSALRDIDTGEMLCGPAVLDGRSVLDYLQSITSTEQGRLFISHDGKVTFHQRDRFLTQANESTSQFTFSDDGAGGAVIEAPTFGYDERRIYNRASVTREGGDAQIVDNTSSQAIYGVKTFDLSGLALRDDRHSRALADAIVARYATPQVRVGLWALQPELDATNWADVFGLALGHRVTVENKPANTGAQTVVDVHLESISERINPRTWKITFSGSPVDPNAANYFTWGGNGATQGWGVGVWR